MNELRQSQLDEIIAAHPFLKGLEAQYLLLFFKAATYQRFGIDSLIFRAACDADHFYLIHKGAVTLESFVPGRGVTTVQTSAPGRRWAGPGSFHPIFGISVRVQSSQLN